MKIPSPLRFVSLLTLIISCFSLSHAKEPILEKAIESFEDRLSRLRVTREDLSLPASKYLSLTLPEVENLFKDPMETTEKSVAWAKKTGEARSLAALFEVAKTIIKSTGSISTSAQTPTKLNLAENNAPALKKEVEVLYREFEKAHHHLSVAVNSLSKKERDDFLSLVEWSGEKDVIKQELSSRVIKKKYEAMKKFKQAELLAASDLALRALDTFLVKLSTLPAVSQPIVWKTPLGKIRVHGKEDDTYTNEDYANTLLLLDFGGSNTHTGPAAFAQDNQIRVVIDLGENVVVQTSTHARPNAGSGLFGIGLLYLPNPAGLKTVLSGSYSQGCGIGGLGGLFIKGKARVEGARYVQGVGSFGAGLLFAQNATESNYTATRMGQGVGLVRGVGLFRHHGNKTTVLGGLVEPDPREPLGSVSLCQGVGYGKRAYSGGGVGIAHLKGNQINVKGSYFAQGVGYWHALGVFRLEGNNSTMQARRYDQGSGVHYAFGHFDLRGNKNRVLNWGVGPAFGWDQSYGSAIIKGNENEVQAKWGTATASIGSLSFSYISGDRNKLHLPDYANGGFFRNMISYSFHVIAGKNNLFQSVFFPEEKITNKTVMTGPWGAFSVEDITVSRDLKLTPPVWDELPQEKPLERAMANLETHIRQAQEKTPVEQVGDLVDVAAAFSLDKESPRKALKHLLQLPDGWVPELITVLDPVAVEQLIHLSIVIPAYGDAIVHVVKDRWDSYNEQKRFTLYQLLRHHRPSLVLPFLIEKKEVQVLRALGHQFNVDTGREPGLKALLLGVVDHLTKPKNKKKADHLHQMLSHIRMADAYGLISMVLGPSNKNRLALFDVAPKDITGTIEKKGATTLINLFMAEREKALKNTRKELVSLDRFEEQAREKMKNHILLNEKTGLHKKGAGVLKAALVLCGQIANPADLLIPVRFLSHPRAGVREAAAAALARFGDASIRLYKDKLKNADSKTRTLLMVSLAHSGSHKLVSLLAQGLKDRDPGVRQATLATIRKLAPALSKLRKKLIKTARGMLKKEVNQEVRLSGAFFQ